MQFFYSLFVVEIQELEIFSYLFEVLLLFYYVFESIISIVHECHQNIIKVFSLFLRLVELVVLITIDLESIFFIKIH